MTLRLDKRAVSEAVRKTAKLRIEDVGGRKERPAETVQSCLNRGFATLGSAEGLEYILRHAIRYYLEAAAQAGDERDQPGLTEAEQKAQGARCGCKGVNDMCVCQNVTDATTRADRAQRGRR